MLKKFEIIFKVFIILIFSISITKAELLKPNSDIKPSKVVEIQSVSYTHLTLPTPPYE